MSHPKNILRKFFRERVPKLLNSFMAASMLLNTLSPVFFLGDLAQNSNYLKGFRYSGAARHEKIQALGFEAPDLAADFRLDDSVAYFSLPDFADILDVPGEIALGASLLPAWMADSPTDPILGSALVPAWMAESTKDDDSLGTELLPVWMASSADAPPPRYRPRCRGLCSSRQYCDGGYGSARSRQPRRFNGGSLHRYCYQQ